MPWKDDDWLPQPWDHRHGIKRDWDNFPQGKAEAPASLWAPSHLTAKAVLQFSPRVVTPATEFYCVFFSVKSPFMTVWCVSLIQPWNTEHHNTLGWSFRLWKVSKSPISFHVFHAKPSEGFSARGVRECLDRPRLCGTPSSSCSKRSRERKRRKVMLKTPTHLWGATWSLQGFSLAQHLLGLRKTSYLFEFVVNRFWPDKYSILESLSVLCAQGKPVFPFLSVQQAAATWKSISGLNVVFQAGTASSHCQRYS